MKRKKVIVAMSGGVDSSVAALLLRREGCRVVGVHFRQGDYAGDCCGNRGLADARRAAQQLDIDFYAIDCRKEFEREVIDYFCRTYAEGLTPSPCINCNGRLRFPRLLKLAEFLEFDQIATGHYARLEDGPGDGCRFIARATDPKKDQSYFLLGLERSLLDRIIWPLGSLSKSEVRELARGEGLRVSEKPESQDICFIPDGNYAEFLKEVMPESFSPGPILDREGKRLGTHSGLPLYTVGQRKGLGVHSAEPLYVLRIEPETNTIYVGKEEETYSSQMAVSRCNWLGDPPPEGDFPARVKIRSQHPGGAATVRVLSPERVEVDFDRPQRSVAPGQGAAFYRDDRLLGGGIID